MGSLIQIKRHESADQSRSPATTSTCVPTGSKGKVGTLVRNAMNW
jgi:hypothetical protein